MEGSNIDKLAVGIAGAGRMAEAIVRAVDSSPGLEVTGLWAREPAAAAKRLGLQPDRVSADLDRVAAASDVLIDFSLPEATAAVLDAAVGHGKPLVCGVSGLGGGEMAALDAAARRIPIVFDRNMSQGIAVLQRLIVDAARALGAGFDVEIHETHHVHKRDAPSGTALKLGEALAAERGVEPGDLQYHVERRGEVPGEHAVVFRSGTETLTLEHSVTTRAVFAEGALRAARWVADRDPGRYSMQDVLG